MRVGRARGAALVVCAALGYASVPIVAKHVFTPGFGVLDLLSLRFALAAALLIAFLVWRRSARPGARTIVAGLALGALIYAPTSGLYFASLTRLDAGLAALLASAYPALVVVVAGAMGMERLDARRAGAALAALAGLAVVLVGAGAVRPDTAGVVLALSSAAGYSAYVLAGAVAVRGDDPVMVAALVAAGCAVAFTAAGVVSGGLSAPGDTSTWLWVAAAALLGTALPLAAFLAGAPAVGPGAAGMLMTAEPLATAFAAGLLLAEPLSPVQWAGAGLAVAAVAAIARRPLPVPASQGSSTSSPGGRRPDGMARTPDDPSGAGAGFPTESAQRSAHGGSRPTRRPAAATLLSGKNVAGQVP